ncbi:MAG: CDP-diacylglycerol--glycerol-3-phosphate 3-phosphatidyltransferase [Clostridia bacterium]
MNLPNKITLSRIFLVPLFMLFLIPIPDWVVFSGVFSFMKSELLIYNTFVGNYGYIIAGIIFIVASSTDAVDGYIARKHKLVTNLGKFLDPIADKLLVTAALLALVQTGTISSWTAMIIIGREFIVTGIRLVAVGEGIVISASNLGKIKTVTQMIAIILALFKSFFDFPFYHVAMAIAIVMTVYSGFDYVRHNLSRIIEHEKRV